MLFIALKFRFVFLSTDYTDNKKIGDSLYHYYFIVLVAKSFSKNPKQFPILLHHQQNVL
jgi:hypothetical protein